MVCLKDYKMPETCEDYTLESYCSLWVDARRTSDDGERATTRHQDCPLIEVPKQKRGKLLTNEFGYESCSVCNYGLMLFITDEDNILRRPNFCPNCGARMVANDDGA